MSLRWMSLGVTLFLAQPLAWAQDGGAPGGLVEVVPGTRLGPLALGMPRDAVARLGLPSRPGADPDSLRVGPYDAHFDASGHLESVQLELRRAPGALRIGGRVAASNATFAQLLAAAPGCGPVEQRVGNDVASCAQGGLRIVAAGPSRAPVIAVERPSATPAAAAPTVLEGGRRVRVAAGRELMASEFSAWVNNLPNRRTGRAERQRVTAEAVTGVAIDVRTGRVAVAARGPEVNLSAPTMVFVFAPGGGPPALVRRGASRAPSRRAGSTDPFGDVTTLRFDADGTLRVTDVGPSSAESECTFGPDLAQRGCRQTRGPD